MSYRIRSGDTLSSIAGRYRTSVAALAQANNIQDPNRIITGRDLRIPGRDTPSARNTGRPVSPQVPSPPSRVPVPQPRPFQDDSFSTNPQQTQTPRTEEARTTWADPNQPGKSYESRDGVPRYSQFDSDWASNRLGGEGTVSTESRDSVYKQGCAITASAMAVSALSGQTFTPGQMDAYLDDAGAYSGNSVDFNRVGGAVNTQPPIESKRVFGGLTPDAIDQQLDAGRPVVVGVNYRSSNTQKPDHWLTVTGRNADGSYRANDPNGGGELNLHRDGNRLVASKAEGAKQNYVFSGQGVTFSGGNPVRPQATNNPDVFAEGSLNPTELAPTDLTPTELAPSEPATTTRDNAILGELRTTGAGTRTAAQDGVTPGVEGSQKLAENDSARLRRFQEDFQDVAREYNLPPALLAAIASRESRGGNALNAEGWAKYDANGYGLMQIDAKHNPDLIRGGPYSREHIAAAAERLSTDLRTIQDKHPDWTPAEQLRGAVAAYNFGTRHVQTLGGLDRGTTGDDYSADVWARAQYLANQGF